MEEKYRKKSVLILLLQQLRPKQWVKNGLIFAALIFSFQSFQISELYELLWKVLIGFFIFSFVSGSVYVLNDFMDREADKQHPEKCKRPMASGQLNPYLAIVVGGILLISSLVASWFLNPLFSIVLIIYFCLNVAYSIKLKHVVIIDIMIVASGFVFRAISGALIIKVPFTPWFLLCTMLLALFLAVGKRRHELVLLQNNKAGHRKVLEFYSVPLIDQMISIITAATLLSYSLFTFDSGRTIHLMWTIPFVIYGIFRYLYLIHIEGKGGKPEKVLFQDKPILITVILYVVSVIAILICFE